MTALAEHFRRPELAWLVDRLAARVEQGRPLDRGSATRNDPTDGERRAIDDLMGRPTSRGRTLSVDLPRLAERLGLDDAGLRALVTTLRGPLENRRAARAAETAAWESLFTRWTTRLAGDAGELRWLDELRATGLLRRLAGRDPARAETFLEQVGTILEQRPHDDVLLASLAARVAGDSHALDRGRPLATLCLRAIVHAEGIDLPTGAGSESRREAWAAIGVSLDDLSAPVLCLNLPAAATCDAAPWIGWHVERGEPFFLTRRQVHGFLPSPQVAAVFICENPAVVSEAANRLGPRSRPLVCLNGLPASPALALVRSLGAHGIPLRVRADFDWTGLRIIGRILRAAPATELWRMNADDYRGGAARSTRPLDDPPFLPEWAPELAAAMAAAGVAVHEEDLVDRLVDDLDSDPGRPSRGPQSPPPAAPGGGRAPH